MRKIFIALLVIPLCSLFAQEPETIILDADTGNEVDDLYAIVRALVEPSWNIKALNATQWQASQWAVDRTMEESHRLNQILLAYLEMGEKVKALRGGAGRMYDWGDKAQHSAAAYGIIRQAHQMKEGEKLTVVVLGALTNVASAIYIEPAIESRLKVYWLGTSYDFEKELSRRIDFNAVMDIQATEILLSSNVEMHIIPVNVAGQMVFDYDETRSRLKDQHPLADYLLDRWYNHMDAGVYRRTIWDLSLIEAMIHPGLAEEVKVASFQNKNVWMYRDIDEEAMIRDFFQTTQGFLKNAL
ncbi:MAG: nucleoside hydrolase [Bacteroidales bacterium]